MYKKYNVIVGNIARRYSDYYHRYIYTAFYPDSRKREWVYEEFFKFGEAKEWLIKELEGKYGN